MTWENQWLWAIFIIAWIVNLFWLIEVNVTLGLLFFWLVSSGVIAMQQPFSEQTSFTLLSLFAVVSFTALLNAGRIYFIAAIGFISAVIGLFYPQGICGNASMNACLVALTLPAMIVWTSEKRKPKWALPIVAVCLTSMYLANASLPFGILCVIAYAMTFVNAQTFLATPISIVLGAAAAIYQGPSFFEHTGRFPYWQRAWEYFSANADPWFGFGLGTSSEIMRMEGLKAGQVYWPWLHNDWLQLLVETGWIGLLIGVLTYAVTLYKARNRTWLFGSLAGYGACMFFNFPFHLPLTAFVGMALLWETWRGEGACKT